VWGDRQIREARQKQAGRGRYGQLGAGGGDETGADLWIQPERVGQETYGVKAGGHADTSLQVLHAAGAESRPLG
jgi:hypothetical protein